MTLIQTLGSLTEILPPWAPGTTNGAAVSAASYAPLWGWDYEQIYATQPSVRKVIDFLGRNIAQLGLQIFERAGDTDRVRITTGPLADLIARPNPSTTRYQFLDGFVRDMCTHGNAYAAKIKLPSRQPALVLLPPWLVVAYGGLLPTGYALHVGGKRLDLQPDEILHSRLGGRVVGLSPLETLRGVLAEEAAASTYRSKYFQNSARVGGVLTRPLEAPAWSDTARTRFRAEWESMYSGELNSGRTAILEEGMAFTPMTTNAVDSQYLEGRKFSLETVCTQYHIPPPMVGILEHATYSNIDMQHQMLYQDTLGPWLTQISEDWDMQLVPDFAPNRNIYVEFNMEEKLRGSFTERFSAYQTAVGRPWMTASEARARENLPDIGGDSDALVTPLNVLVGTGAPPPPPTNTLPKGVSPVVETKAARGVVDPTLSTLRARHRQKWAQVLGDFFGRQSRAVMSKVGAAEGKKAAYSIDDLYDAARWDAELEADVLALSGATARVWGTHTASAFGADLDDARLMPWLKEHARIAASNINLATLAALAAALRGDTPREDLARVFETATSSRADQIAQSQVTQAANFGSHSGAEQAGARTKGWQVNSGNPRSQHAALDGERVPLGEPFSNGMAWPGDPAGGADNVANCQCSVLFEAEA